MFLFYDSIIPIHNAHCVLLLRVVNKIFFDECAVNLCPVLITLWNSVIY